MKTKLSRDRRKKLLNILASHHSHSEVAGWAKCVSCQDKFQEYKREKAKLTLEQRVELHEDLIDKAVRLYIGKYMEAVKMGKINPHEPRPAN